ncbi:MAG: endonuclease/exonuclease/phosphatase family protein [Kiritimatiellia bacterium]
MPFSAVTLLAAVVVGTWNGNWFPSGRAEHRASPEVEEATVAAAAKMLAAGLRATDPQGTNDVILCLNEIRGPRVAADLVRRIGRPGLRMAVISGYRRRDRFDQQQDVIATTLPVADAHWSRWRAKDRKQPPRGYAFAAVVIAPAVTAAVYAVHLKSNYGAGKPEVAAACRELRTIAVEQLVGLERAVRGKRPRPVIVAGDLNADRWRRDYSAERIFDLLDDAGFANPLEALPATDRGTHSSARYGDSTLDYVLCRGVTAVGVPHIAANDGVSDHRAVFVLVKVL